MFGFDIEERVRTLENRMSTHDAVCAERYKEIIEATKANKELVLEVSNKQQRRLDWMIMAVIALSLASSFGPEIASKLFGIVIK